MIKHKVSSTEIEQIFKFMNIFKFNEIVNHKYFLENKEGTELHVLIFDIGGMTNRSYMSRVRRYLQTFGDVVKIEKIE